MVGIELVAPFRGISPRDSGTARPPAAAGGRRCRRALPPLASRGQRGPKSHRGGSCPAESAPARSGGAGSSSCGAVLRGRRPRAELLSCAPRSCVPVPAACCRQGRGMAALGTRQPAPAGLSSSCGDACGGQVAFSFDHQGERRGGNLTCWRWCRLWGSKWGVCARGSLQNSSRFQIADLIVHSSAE